MHIIEPDFSIPIPLDFVPLQDFREKAEAACRTAEEIGIDTTPTEQDKKKLNRLSTI